MVLILVIAVMLYKLVFSICYNTLWCGVYGAFMVSHCYMHSFGELRLRAKGLVNLGFGLRVFAEMPVMACCW